MPGLGSPKLQKNSPADASTGVIFISPARVNLILPKGVSPACPKGSNTRAFSTYFEEMTKKRYQKWEIVYLHFHKFTGGKCTFGEVTVDLCTRFREYLLNTNQLRHKTKKGLAQLGCWLFLDFPGIAQTGIQGASANRKH